MRQGLSLNLKLSNWLPDLLSAPSNPLVSVIRCWSLKAGYYKSVLWIHTQVLIFTLQILYQLSCLPRSKNKPLEMFLEIYYWYSLTLNVRKCIYLYSSTHCFSAPPPFIYYFMCSSVLPACLSVVPHVCLVPGETRRGVPDFLELKFQLGAGAGSWILWERTWHSYHLVKSPAVTDSILLALKSVWWWSLSSSFIFIILAPTALV